MFEERKLDAYEFLGITTHEDQTLRLTPLGWKFARVLEADTKIFRQLLHQLPAYLNALSWISQQNIDLLTSIELCDFWQEEHCDGFAFDDQEAMRGSVVSFFSICQAAGLGTMTLGKRGHITRFFVDREELATFLSAGSLASFGGGSMVDTGPETFKVAATTGQATTEATAAAVPTVLIQCKNPRIVELIQSVLAIANVRSRPVEVIWERNGSAAERQPGGSREFSTLIVVLGEESFTKDHSGTSVMKDSVLLELGAALVLYERRVILIADKANSACEWIKDLICCELDGERLDWEAALQLIKLVTKFREQIIPTVNPPILVPHECRA